MEGGSSTQSFWSFSRSVTYAPLAPAKEGLLLRAAGIASRMTGKREKKVKEAGRSSEPLVESVATSAPLVEHQARRASSIAAPAIVNQDLALVNSTKKGLGAPRGRAQTDAREFANIEEGRASPKSPLLPVIYVLFQGALADSARKTFNRPPVRQASEDIEGDDCNMDDGAPPQLAGHKRRAETGES